MDPLAGTPWSSPSTVEGFSKANPNIVLIEYASRIVRRAENAWVVDIGCGAGRNAVPLGRLGWRVIGLDLSRPMLEAGLARARTEGVDSQVSFAMAPMDALPVAGATADLIVAHGIWNLAASAAEMRRGVLEAARIARAGAALFVFTFSRHTLPADAEPVAGEAFVFTQFSGRPQCFLTEDQLIDELRAAGFERDPAVPFSEYNRPAAGAIRSPSGPVIYEAAFRRVRIE
jgi:SAM-dependent methyltransferase